MEIDFQNQNTLDDKIKIIRQLFERLNMNYGNIVNMSVVENAIDNIEIVKDDLSNVSEEVKYMFEHGALGVCGESKVYVKENVEVDTLFHEMLHYISANSRGLCMPLLDAYTDEEKTKYIKMYGQRRLIDQMDQLNEAMTRYITELAIPEIPQKDAYQFGALFLRLYDDKLTEKGIDTKFLFDMYINGNVESMKKFKDSLGDKFQDILDNIERWHNIRFYIMRPDMKPTLSSDNISDIIDEVVGNMKMR